MFTFRDNFLLSQKLIGTCRLIIRDPKFNEIGTLSNQTRDPKQLLIETISKGKACSTVDVALALVHSGYHRLLQTAYRLKTNMTRTI